MKLRSQKGNGGHITSYSITLGSKEARELGFTREDGSGRELKKVLDIEHGVLTVTVDWDAEMAYEKQ